MYEIRLSHIFKIPRITNEKPRISIEILGISNRLGFSHLEFEILGTSKICDNHIP